MGAEPRPGDGVRAIAEDRQAEQRPQRAAKWRCHLSAEWHYVMMSWPRDIHPQSACSHVLLLLLHVLIAGVLSSSIHPWPGLFLQPAASLAPVQGDLNLQRLWRVGRKPNAFYLLKGHCG